MTFRPRLAIFLLLAVVGVPPAHAQLGLRLGPEYFQWREHNSNGSRLLEETGPRFRLGVQWDKRLLQTLLLQVDGGIYFGDVDYDGQAGPPGGPYFPFNSETDYRGIAGNAGVAFYPSGPRGFHFFGGLGFDQWRRDIAGHSGVFGVVEDWTVVNLFAGIGAQWRAGAEFRARAGLKYPFYTYELANAYDVELNPEGQPSLFLRFTTDFGGLDDPRWGVGAYYDSYRFDESDRKRVGSIIIWQPRSEQDAIGLYAVIYLR